MKVTREPNRSKTGALRFATSHLQRTRVTVEGALATESSAALLRINYCATHPTRLIEESAEGGNITDKRNQQERHHSASPKESSGLERHSYFPG